MFLLSPKIRFAIASQSFYYGQPEENQSGEFTGPLFVEKAIAPI